MLRTILPLIPPHKSYVEPFCGGAAVFFSKELAYVNTINDTNEALINFYRQAKINPKALIKELNATPYSRRVHKIATEIYNNERKATPLKKAWAFFVANNQGFSGQINAGWGMAVTSKFKGQSVLNLSFRNKIITLKNILHKLANCQIECKDALLLIQQYDYPEAFMFIDPPYPDTHQGHYEGYSMADFERLLDILPTLKCKWMLTSYPYKELDERCAQHGWRQMKFSKTLSAKKVKIGETKTKKIECITLNYTPPQGNLF